MAKKVGSHKKVSTNNREAIINEAIRLKAFPPNGGMVSTQKLSQVQRFAKKRGIVLSEMSLYKLLGVSQRNKRVKPNCSAKS